MKQRGWRTASYNRPHKEKSENWNIKECIRGYGFRVNKDVRPKPFELRVSDIAEKHAKGIYVVYCKKHAYSRAGHLVCINDGKILDTWDSLNQVVIRMNKITPLKK